MKCRDCQGTGWQSAAAGVSVTSFGPCRMCGGSGIASCCEAEMPGEDAVVLHLSPERRLLVRQELYHAAHTLEAEARSARAPGTRSRSLRQRAEHLRAVADQLA